MVDLGKAVGRETVAVLTNMNQPLGHAIGNRNEITEAVNTLNGKGTSAFRHFIAELAQIMLALAGVEKLFQKSSKTLIMVKLMLNSLLCVKHNTEMQQHLSI